MAAVSWCCLNCLPCNLMLSECGVTSQDHVYTGHVTDCKFCDTQWLAAVIEEAQQHRSSVVCALLLTILQGDTASSALYTCTREARQSITRAQAASVRRFLSDTRGRATSLGQLRQRSPNSAVGCRVCRKRA